MQLVVGRMMPLTSDAPEVTKSVDNSSDRKLRSIEDRPTEVEGSEENQVIVEDAAVVMGSPKVDAVVAGDAGSKTTPDKVGSSSSSSKGGMDSGGSPAAPAIKSGSGSTRGDEGVPEGSPGEAGPPAESSSSAAPSIASHGGGSGPRWDEDILHLLDDVDGVALFKQYLEQEQLGHYLNFYFFCNGFRETVESPAKLRKIVRMAHRDFIAGGATSKPSKYIECLDQDVRSAIAVASRNLADAIDMHMFDAAQQQVLDFMRRTSYIKFFESDVYIDYIQSLQTRDSSSSKPHSSASSVSGRQGGTESAIDQIAATGGSPRLHHRDVSQMTGEASKSSGSNNGQQVQLPYDLVTVDEERELNLPLASSATSTAKTQQLPAKSSTGEVAKLPGKVQSPRLSQETLNRMQQAMGDLHPAVVGAGGGGGQRLLSSAAGAAAPYHAMSSTFNPTSRNDSEIQSQSSGALGGDTTDNCSSFTEQSGSTFSANQAALHQRQAQMRRRQQKSERMMEQQEIMRQARTNHRDTAAPSCFNPNRAGALGPASRNQPEMATKDPAQFFEKLKSKLQKVQLERESSVKLRERGVAPPAAMSMSTTSRSKRHETYSQQHQISQNYDPESDQSILDEHCSKVFDHTPVRGRSPPTERSKKVKAHKGSGSYMTWSKGQQAYGGLQGEIFAFEWVHMIISYLILKLIITFVSIHFSPKHIFPPTRTLILLWPSRRSGQFPGICDQC